MLWVTVDFTVDFLGQDIQTISLAMDHYLTTSFFNVFFLDFETDLSYFVNRVVELKTELYRREHG